jgi:hypothetical protein
VLKSGFEPIPLLAVTLLLFPWVVGETRHLIPLSSSRLRLLAGVVALPTLCDAVVFAYDGSLLQRTTTGLRLSFTLLLGVGDGLPALLLEHGHGDPCSPALTGLPVDRVAACAPVMSSQLMLSLMNLRAQGSSTRGFVVLTLAFGWLP